MYTKSNLIFFYFFILCLRIALPKRIAELRPKHQSVCCIYKHISLNGEEGNQTFSSNFSHKNRVSEMESQSDSVSFCVCHCFVLCCIVRIYFFKNRYPMID